MTKNNCDVCGKNYLYKNGEKTDGTPIYVSKHARINALWHSKELNYREDHSCSLCESCYYVIKNYIEEVLGGNIVIKKYVPTLDSSVEEWMTEETPKNLVPRADNG